MKVSQATINFYLKTAKTLSDGSHPIMLRVCFNGYKDVSTHYSCTVRYWDKKNQVIKKGYPNYTVSNYELDKLKSKIIKKRNEYIRLGIEYTPSMLLSNDEKKGISNVVSELIESYYKDRELTQSTIEGWNHSKRLLEEYHKGLIITELDEGWVKRYANWLKVDRGLSDGTIRTRLGHIAAIYRYAAGKGLCDMMHYPYRDWNYCQRYKIAENLEYIHRKSIDVMKEYFLSKVISTNGEVFSYIDDGYINYKHPLFPLYFWLLGFLFQGLSPIDLCLLRKDDFVVKRINDVDYWCIDTQRLKTGVGVKIRIRKDSIYSQVMIGRCMMEGDGWFMSVLRGKDSNDLVRCKNKVSSVFSYWICPYLKGFWKEINNIIIRRNVEEGSEIPLINEECTMYSYRHSYAQVYIHHPKASPLALATLMGRSVNTLSTYIQQLSEEDELVDAVSVIED